MTQFSFDASCEYPKVILDQDSFLTQDEYVEIKELRSSPEIDAVASAFSDDESTQEHEPAGDDSEEF